MNDRTFFIAITGEARAGKDTLASLLYAASPDDFEIKSLAGTVKDIERGMRESYISSVVTLLQNEGIFKRKVNVDKLLQKLEANDWKNRPVLQAIGQNCRNIVGESVWIDALKNSVGDNEQFVILSDVRYPNELEELCDFHIHIYANEADLHERRVNSGEVNGVMAHESERMAKELSSELLSRYSDIASSKLFIPPDRIDQVILNSSLAEVSEVADLCEVIIDKIAYLATQNRSGEQYYGDAY